MTSFSHVILTKFIGNLFEKILEPNIEDHACPGGSMKRIQHKLGLCTSNVVVTR